MTEDLNAYVADSAHSITIDAVTKPCLFSEGDEVTLSQGGGAGQIAAQAVATVITGDFPAVKGNDPCTVTTKDADGNVISTRNFTVWRRLRIQDGALTELLLKKV